MYEWRTNKPQWQNVVSAGRRVTAYKSRSQHVKTALQKAAFHPCGENRWKRRENLVDLRAVKVIPPHPSVAVRALSAVAVPLDQGVVLGISAVQPETPTRAEREQIA